MSGFGNDLTNPLLRPIGGNDFVLPRPYLGGFEVWSGGFGRTLVSQPLSSVRFETDTYWGGHRVIGIDGSIIGHTRLNLGY